MAGPLPIKKLTSNVRRCVVVAAQAENPAALLTALRKRSLDVMVAHALPEVMVALAEAHDAVVVVVEPGQFERVGELLDAIWRYYPKAACWRYDNGLNAGGGARLAVMNGEFTRKPGANHGHENGGEKAGAMDVEDTERTVSEEELMMLLGPLDG